MLLLCVALVELVKAMLRLVWAVRDGCAGADSSAHVADLCGLVWTWIDLPGLLLGALVSTEISMLSAVLLEVVSAYPRNDLHAMQHCVEVVRKACGFRTEVCCSVRLYPGVLREMTVRWAEIVGMA